MFIHILNIHYPKIVQHILINYERQMIITLLKLKFNNTLNPCKHITVCNFHYGIKCLTDSYLHILNTRHMCVKSSYLCSYKLHILLSYSKVYVWKNFHVKATVTENTKMRPHLITFVCH